MEDFTGIVNWENVLKQSTAFKKNKPFKFAFIEEFFEKEFYEKLYQTFPAIDDKWVRSSVFHKNQFVRYWVDSEEGRAVVNKDEPYFSQEWNKFKRYVHTDEFINYFREFSGTPVTNLKYFHFVSYRKGGFQLPHIHNVGPSTLIMMFYFSKNWKKGDPGGTYMAKKCDESSIIFEPHNLDNSMAIFLDGPKSAHGVRYISKDVERKALQVTLEEYSLKTGWSGGNPKITGKLLPNQIHS